MLPRRLSLLVRISFSLLHFLRSLLAARVVLIVVLGLMLFLLVLGRSQCRGLHAGVIGCGRVIIAGATVNLGVIVLVIPSTWHGGSLVDLVERAGIAAVVMLHEVASRRIPARYWFVEHLRLIKVLLMILGRAIRVNRAHMAARTTTHIRRILELLLLLLRWSLMVIFRRALRTAPTMFIGLVTILLILLPRFDMILLFIVHSCVLKFNMSFGSCRHTS